MAQPLPQRRKRAAKSVKCNGNKEKCLKPKTKANGQLSARMRYTVAKILSTWDDTTKFGMSFRGMNAIEQSLMKECITDALQKEKGGNCVRSYASLAKVNPKLSFPSSCVM
jgi:hypothetical protein